MLGALTLAACTGGVEPTTTSTTMAPFDAAGWGRDHVVAVSGEGVGIATGLVIGEEGLILTTASSVVGANRVEVTLPGEPVPREATLEAAAECLDLALVRLVVPGSLAAVELSPGGGAGAWTVVADAGRVSAGAGVEGSHGVVVDATGVPVQLLSPVRGGIGLAAGLEVVDAMRHGELTSQLGFVAADRPGGLEVLTVAHSLPDDVRPGDLIVAAGESAPPDLAGLCGLSERPLAVELVRGGRRYRGELGGAPIRLASSRTAPQIREATVRVDVDLDGDGDRDGSGSGFFLSADGLVLTNHHVIAGAAATGSVELVLDGGGRRLPASIVGRSSCSDLALLDVGGDGFQFLEFASLPPAPDSPVRSVGYPDGSDTVSIERGSVSKDPASPVFYTPTLPTFEHSAPAIPGSSGGPVVNDDGEVVGVVFAGRLAGGQTEELAIDGQAVAEVATRLEGGDIDHVGLNLFQSDFAVLVDRVDPQSTADALGLMPGDAVYWFSGVDVRAEGIDVASFCRLALDADRPDPIEVIRSEGELLEGELPGTPLRPEPAPVTVTDPLGVVAAATPGRWAETEPITGDAGADPIGFRVAPDLAAYRDDRLGRPGMEVTVSSRPVGTPRELVEAIDHEQCRDAGIEPVVSGVFDGLVRRWLGCGGVDSSVVEAALTSGEQTVIVRVTAADRHVDRYLAGVLDTLTVTAFPGG